MHHLRLLMAGVLSIGAICLAGSLKADGIMPVDPSKDPAPPIVPCDCTCRSVTVSDLKYEQFFTTDQPVLGGDNDIISMKVTFSMTNGCRVKLVATVRALRYSATDSGEYVTWYDEWKPLGSVDSGDYGTETITGHPPYGVGRIAWWEVQVYVVRTCDNTIVGWTDVYTVTP